MGALRAVTILFRLLLQSCIALVGENPPFPQHVAVLQRAVKRPGLRRRDRVFWVWSSRLWRGRWSSLILVQPDTVGPTSSVASLGLDEVPAAARSPWQNVYSERFIGSLRRECLDHVIVLNRRHPHRFLVRYSRYYNRSRTHLALAKHRPDPRRVRERGLGEVLAFPEVGGLHHRCVRRAA